MSDKDFVVKNGLVVNTSLIAANAAAGKVGIANATPDATLTVGGTANVQGNAVVTGTLSLSAISANSSKGTSGYVLKSGGSSSNAYWDLPPVSVSNTGGTGAIQYYDGSSLASNAGLKYTAASSTLAVTNTVSTNNVTAANVVSALTVTSNNITTNGVTVSNTLTLTGTISANGSLPGNYSKLASNGSSVYWDTTYYANTSDYPPSAPFNCGDVWYVTDLQWIMMYLDDGSNTGNPGWTVMIGQ